MVKKYPPGAIISQVKSSKTKNFGDLSGKKLKGQMYLEVPVQDKLPPKKVLEYAKKLKIKIRDIDGTIYK